MDNSKLISTLNLILDNAREAKESLKTEVKHKGFRTANVASAMNANDNIISMLESLINELKPEVTTFYPGDGSDFLHEPPNDQK